MCGRRRPGRLRPALFLLLFSLVLTREAGAGFGYRKLITIDHTKVGATLTDFPVLISLSSDNDLKNHVTSASGYDILFRTSDGWTTLDHEVESWDGTTGTLVAWVRIPSLSSSADTVIYLYYGNSSITTSIENKTGVWDSHYAGVWHLGNGTSLSMTDSTSNGNNGSGAGSTPAAGTGKVGGGASITTSAQINFGHAASLGGFTTETMEYWIKPDGNNWGFELDKNKTTEDTNTIRDFTSHQISYRRFWTARTTWVFTSTRSAGNWYHIVVTYDAGNANNEPICYFNGSSDAIASALSYPPTGSPSNDSTADLLAGRTNCTSGVWDEIRYSNTVRASTWISTEYNNMSSPSTFYSVGSESSNPPTAVTLARFEGRAIEDQVLLEWETGFEADNLGFHLYRDSGRGPERITPDLIAGSALLVGEKLILPAGHTYRWLDRLPPGRARARYWLQDVDLEGKKTWHGPAEVEEMRVPQAVALLGAPGRSPLLGSLNRNACPHRLPAARAGCILTSPRPVWMGTIHPRPSASALAAARNREERQAALAGMDAIKLLVAEEGWYRVGLDALVAAGLDPAADTGRLRLYTGGVEVPLNVQGACHDRFESRGALEFYGIGMDTPYSGTRTYWLVEGPHRGKRLRIVEGRGTASSPPSFPSVVELKERKSYFAALRNGDAENFFGAIVRSEGVDQVLVLEQLDPRPPADALLEVSLQGVTTLPHQVVVSLNGIEVAEATFSGQSRGTVEAAVPRFLLFEGENTVRLEARGGETDVSLVDRIRLTYWRTFTAEGGSLIFPSRGGQEVTVDGFLEPGIRVMDVTVPSLATQIACRVVRRPTGYAAQLRVPGKGKKRLFAFSEEAVRSPLEIRPNQPSRWRAEEEGADLVIISHRDFLSSLEPLKTLRETEGHEVAVVDVEDLYDEFNYGEKDPRAIKDFLGGARQSWSRKPVHVLLVGDATFDPRDYLGLGDADFVPTKLIDTRYLETASDDWFADFEGSGVPSMALGRLPVRTAEEARAAVGKVLAYQRAPPGDWSKRVLFVTDPALDFDFQSVGRRAATLLPAGLEITQVSGGDGTGDAPDLPRLLDDGVLLVDYIGHGSVEGWRGGLLSSAAARGLENGPRLPLVIAMTCLNGFFHDVYTECLGEALLKAEGGGAVAAWASSGLTDPSGQAVMSLEFLRLLFTGEAATLGEAAARAKAATDDPDVRRTWILFGDPSLRIR